MSALFAGFLRTPMAAIFMAVEVSDDYAIIVPAMISSVLAYLVGHRLQPIAIFDLIGRQDGWQLPSMEQEREAAVLRVEDAMDPAPPVIPADHRVADAAAVLRELGAADLLIHAPGGGCQVLGAAALLTLADRGAGDTPLGAFCPAIYPDHSLRAVLHHLHAWPILPVRNRADGASLQGVLTLDAALRLSIGKTRPS